MTPRTKLLVVDDQTINIQVLYQVFSADYQLFMATSGAQALAHCISQQPDLVLLDVEMPDMDGFAVCAQLKSHPATRDIPDDHIGVDSEPPHIPGVWATAVG